MKRFAAVTLATLMLLTVFASAASAEVANTTLNSLEIRGPVYNGSDLNRHYCHPRQWRCHYNEC